MSRTVVGVAWYSRETWNQLRAVAPDGADLESTYDAWVAVFEHGFAQVRAAGVDPRRVELDLPAFMEWCRSSGRPPDSGARAEFVSEQLRLRAVGARSNVE